MGDDPQEGRVDDQVNDAGDRQVAASARADEDAVEEEDLRQLALALIRAERAGSRFVYRVGPPFVRARVGPE